MISAVSNQVSKLFGGCITGDGFYLIKDQELLFVRTITEESDRLYNNYDLHSN